MDEAPSTEKIEFFLRNVFDYLERSVQLTDRPMSDERHWVSKDAPVVHLIFLDDVLVRMPVLAKFVTLFVTGQVFEYSDYVNACVKVMQSLPEADLPDSVIEYTNMLVEMYAQSQEILKPASSEIEEAARRAAAEEASKLEQPVEETVRSESDQNQGDLTPLEKQALKTGEVTEDLDQGNETPPDKLIQRSTAPAPGQTRGSNRGWQ